MEKQDRSLNEELNDAQFSILDALYFVEPFGHLAEEAGLPLPVLRDELRTMIDRGWVHVLRYDEARSDYVKTQIFDSDHMEQYAYLATKAGLMKHNGL